MEREAAVGYFVKVCKTGDIFITFFIEAYIKSSFIIHRYPKIIVEL